MKYIPFVRDDALGRQTQDVEASVSHETKMLRGGYGDSRVKEWGVFNSVAIEAWSAEFEHGYSGGRRGCMCT